MFQHLKKHKRIYVIGHARSGTRIASRMIAHDTGLEFIDETEWGICDIPKLEHIAKYRDNFVVHCPSAYFCIDKFDGLVVWVNREMEDIKKSMDNLKGDRYKILKIMWNDKPTPKELCMTREDRYALFKTLKIKNLMDINYTDLKQHPLWLDKDQRENFFWLQTEKEQFNLRKVV